MTNRKNLSFLLPVNILYYFQRWCGEVGDIHRHLDTDRAIKIGTFYRRFPNNPETPSHTS